MRAMTQPLKVERRPIRSFVLRQGRMTEAQERALGSLLPAYALDPGAGWALPWGDDRPLGLEIGFGNGEHLANLAAARPDWGFIGVEVHRPGIGALLLKAQAQGSANLRVLAADASAWLEGLPAGLFHLIVIQFPDPWPKKRHQKRRLIQAPFAARLARLLAGGGELQLATDWEDYAQQMLTVLDGTDGLVNTAGPGCFATRPSNRIPTRFERRGERLGHAVFDLVYRRP